MHVITANELFRRQKNFVNEILVALIIYLKCAIVLETIFIIRFDY